MRTVGFLLLLALAVPASAEVYKWIDSEGRLHYTDSEESIPKEHRKKAKKTEGRELDFVGGEDVVRAAPRPQGTDRGAAERAERADGAREAAWRQRFQKARAEVEALESIVEQDRRALADPAAAGLAVERQPHGGVRPSAAFEAIRERLPREEKLLEEAKARLADLERKASAESVPQEWRK